MRIYRVVSTISLPDSIDAEELGTILGIAIRQQAGGTTVNRLISELTDETLPTPEVPVETLDL